MKKHIALTLTASAVALLFAGVTASAEDEKKPKKLKKPTEVSEAEKPPKEAPKVSVVSINSGRSNNFNIAPEKTPGTQYTYALSFDLTTSATEMSSDAYESLVDSALAEMKADLMDNYGEVVSTVSINSSRSNTSN